MDEVRAEYQTSARRTCRLLQFPSSTYFYKSRRDPFTEVRMRLRELASSRPRYGYRRLWVLLAREGFKVGHKLVYRLYKEEGL